MNAIAIRRVLAEIVEKERARGALRAGQAEALSLVGAGDVAGVVICAPTGSGKTRSCQLIVRAAATLGLVSVFVAPLAVLKKETSAAFVGLGANVIVSAGDEDEINKLRERVGTAGIAGSSGVAAGAGPTLFVCAVETFANDTVVQLLSGLLRVGQLGPLMFDEAMHMLGALGYRDSMWLLGAALRALMRAADEVSERQMRQRSSTISQVVCVVCVCACMYVSVCCRANNCLTSFFDSIQLLASPMPPVVAMTATADERECGWIASFLGLAPAIGVVAVKGLAIQHEAERRIEVRAK